MLSYEIPFDIELLSLVGIDGNAWSDFCRCSATCHLLQSFFFLHISFFLSTHDVCVFVRHLFLPSIGLCLLDNFVLLRGWIITADAIHFGACRNGKDISGIRRCKAWALIMKCHLCKCICGVYIRQACLHEWIHFRGLQMQMQIWWVPQISV